MNTDQAFEAFLANQSPQISTWGFLLNLALTAVLSYLLGLIYARHGIAISNKRMFASSFELIAVTTMIIISIVKSSLALSLGLVGALSIVRFRAAIKEPQELAYIFLNIAIGLGFGANQRVVTLVGFTFLVVVILLKASFKSSDTERSLNFTLMAKQPVKTTLDGIVNSISPFCKQLDIKSLYENDQFLEVSFLAEFGNFSDLNQARQALNSLDDSFQISFLDHKGII